VATVKGFCLEGFFVKLSPRLTFLCARIALGAAIYASEIEKTQAAEFALVQTRKNFQNGAFWCHA
jgi:hypothetical protein